LTLQDIGSQDVEVAHRALLSPQGVLRSEDDGIGGGMYSLNIEALSSGNAKTPALTRCVERNPLVLAEGSACFIDKESGSLRFGSLLLDEGTVVSLSHKAYLLTFLQLIGW
jgi:hypothetical protein